MAYHITKGKSCSIYDLQKILAGPFIFSKIDPCCLDSLLLSRKRVINKFSHLNIKPLIMYGPKMGDTFMAEILSLSEVGSMTNITSWCCLILELRILLNTLVCMNWSASVCEMKHISKSETLVKIWISNPCYTDVFLCLLKLHLCWNSQTMMTGVWKVQIKYISSHCLI